MSPDDPRHGTNAGYIAHALGDRDYCAPCRAAHVRKRKETHLKHLRGQRAKVDPTGTVRRVQALLALGHTHPEISAASGGAKNISKNVILARRYTHMHVDVVAAIEQAYRKLSMVVPTGWRAEEARRRAAARGYLPPLVWDNIDDPNERPRLGSNHTTKTDLDLVVVDRVLAGDRLPMTTAERRAVVAKARKLGWSEDEIHTRTGIAKATDESRFGAHLPDCGCKPGTAKNGWIEKRASRCAAPNVARDLRDMRADGLGGAA